MYSTVGLLKNAKKSGQMTGTHQKLDRIARRQLIKIMPPHGFFPGIEKILSFEGYRGPDGLKWKSPGVDEPMHFILPNHDDGKLMQMILDHQYNLHQALVKKDEVRAAFEAAWMAHAITDGLTPAHHFPYQEAISELMSDKEYIKIFGKPLKGFMRGDSMMETVRNNWLYLGPEGYMTKHIAFEYGVALVAASATEKALTAGVEFVKPKNIDLSQEFHKALQRIHNLDMYSRFRNTGWTGELAIETKEILLPEIIRMIALGWYSSLPGVYHE